jgi:hypothetical protein
VLILKKQLKEFKMLKPRSYQIEAAHSAAQSAIDDESGWLGGGIVKDYWIAQCAHPLDTIRQDIGDDVLEILDDAATQPARLVINGGLCSAVGRFNLVRAGF